jgi:polysaccharide export outer membrane protein
MHGFKKLLVQAGLLVLLLPLSATAQQEYVIGEGDLLRVTVYDNPDLTTEARVSGDGRISFPLIGEVVVNELSVADAEKAIAAMLEAGYIVKPQVHIFIAEYKSKKVTVLGEVAKPGIVILRGASTLMEVLSDAGGITLNAGDTIVIQRKLIKPSPERRIARSLAEKDEKKENTNKDDKNENAKKDAANNILSVLTEKKEKTENKENDELNVIVDTKRLFEEGDVTANVPVQAGDSIYVPKAAFVYVNGEVKTPGAYKITNGLTVLKAITIAGGFTIKASESRTRIIRKTEKGEVKIKAKFDDLVMPDDIIMVPESYF